MYAYVEYIYFIVPHNGVHNLRIYLTLEKSSKIVMLKSYHKYLIWGIVDEFKIVMLEASRKYNLYDIAIEFKIVMMATNHKFHIKFLFYH
jgi:hypothetical protein